MSKTTKRGKLVIGCALIVAPGCAATTILVPRLKPAEVNLGSVKKIAVGEIEGTGGEDISDRLTQAIMESGKYEVLDRQHLNQIRQEQKLAAGEAGAAQLGKVLGAAALVFGRVSKNSYDEKVTADEGKCADGGGKTHTCTTYVRGGTHRLTVAFKIVDASSAKVLASKTLNGETAAEQRVLIQEPKVSSSTDAGQRYIAEHVPAIDNPDGLRDESMGQVVKGFLKIIAPYTVNVPVVLYEQDELPTSAPGVAAAKAGNWDDAIARLRDAVAAAESNPEPEVKARAHYNLGIALGYSGSYNEGIAEIKKAKGLGVTDDNFDAEIREISGFKKDAEKLKAQGVE